MIVTCRAIMTHLEKLQQCLDNGDTVEIYTDDGRELIGVLSDVGEDYLAIVFAREREIVHLAAISGTDKTEEQKSIQVSKIETILRLTDIRAVSRILKQVDK